ncbi:MAG: alpha/beta hydrolase [Dermatophilaceae bacterium]
MPSLAHEALVGLMKVANRKLAHDDEGMTAEMMAAQIRPRHFAPPRSLDRHVSLQLQRDHGWRVYEMAPRGAALPKHLVVYFHGGGYVTEIDAAHWRVCRRISTLVPARVVVPIYPLAPGATAVTTVPTGADIVQDLLGQTGDEGLVTLMGDSAGGGLAVAVAQELRDRQAGAPRLVLIAPWLDVTMTYESLDEVGTRDPMLSIARLRRGGELYAGELDLKDPRVSPIYGELRGLGPITVLVGTRDLLLHDSRRLRDLAEAHGIEVTYHEEQDLIHVWPILPLPEARRARAAIVGSIRSPRLTGRP